MYYVQGRARIFLKSHGLSLGKDLKIFPSLTAYYDLHLTLLGTSHGLFCRRSVQNFFESHSLSLEKGLWIFPSSKAYIEGRPRNFSVPRPLYKEDLGIFTSSMAYIEGRAASFSKSQGLRGEN